MPGEGAAASGDLPGNIETGLGRALCARGIGAAPGSFAVAGCFGPGGTGSGRLDAPPTDTETILPGPFGLNFGGTPDAGAGCGGFTAGAAASSVDGAATTVGAALCFSSSGTFNCS